MRSILLVFWLSLAAPFAAAQNPDCPATLRVGLSDLGYSSYRQGQEMAGIAVDMMREFDKRTGCKSEFIWFPRSRLYAEFENKKVDLVVGAVHVPARDKLAVFMPYGITQFELVQVHANACQVQSLKEFVDHCPGRLNLVRGIMYPEPVMAQIQRLIQLGRLEFVSDFEIAFKKMSIGRAGATLATPVIYLWHTQHQVRGMEADARPVPESVPQFAGLYASRQTLSPALHSLLIKHLRTTLEDGTQVQIYERHVGAVTARRLITGRVKELVEALQ